MSLIDNWNSFLTENELKEVGIVVCLDSRQRFLIIRRSSVDAREAGAVRELDEETDLLCNIEDLIYIGQPKPKKYYFLTQKWTGEINIDKPNPKTNQVEHDDWKWSTIDEIKQIANSEIPIYLLEKALKIAGFDSDG